MGALRLFLAAGVLTAHFGLFIKDYGFDQPDGRWTLKIQGGHSVVLFYVVSGFLMSYVLAHKYKAGAHGALDFYRARFLRIFPLWWAVLLVVVWSTVGWPEWFATRSLWQAVSPIILFGSDWNIAFLTYPQQNWQGFPAGAGVGWTLGAELTFYILAPWLLRSRIAGIAALLASLLIRVVLSILFWRTQSLLYTWTYFFFPATLCFFLIGHVARLMYSSAIQLVREKQFNALSVVFLLCSLCLSYVFPSYNLIEPVFYVSVILFALALPGIFALTKENFITNFLGDLTYPIYLTGELSTWLMIGRMFPPFGQAVMDLASSTNWSSYWQSALLTSIYILCALAVALLVHLTIEPLATALVRRVFAIPGYRYVLASPSNLRARLFGSRRVGHERISGASPVLPISPFADTGTTTRASGRR
jgi:peptidoglycan/LPS O-acetylase OafA/YrhL